MRLLTRQAREVAGGQVAEPLLPVGRGEVAYLSLAIRDMAYRLTRQVRDTETAREEVAHQAEGVAKDTRKRVAVLTR